MIQTKYKNKYSKVQTMDAADLKKYAENDFRNNYVDEVCQDSPRMTPAEKERNFETMKKKILEPIVFIKNKKGELILEDGRHRIMFALQEKKENIKYVVLDIDIDDRAAIEDYVTNSDRSNKSGSTSQWALAAAKLYLQYEAKRDAIDLLSSSVMTSRDKRSEKRKYAMTYKKAAVLRYGVSEDATKKAVKILRDGHQKTIDSIYSGDVTLSAALEFMKYREDDEPFGNSEDAINKATATDEYLRNQGREDDESFQRVFKEIQSKSDRNVDFDTISKMTLKQLSLEKELKKEKEKNIVLTDKVDKLLDVVTDLSAQVLVFGYTEKAIKGA